MIPIFWPAVFAAFAFDVLFGFLWYGPLWGSVWFEAQGLSADAMHDLGAAYGVSMLGNLIKIVCLSVLIRLCGVERALDGVKVTWLVWLGAVLTIHLGSSLFAGRSLLVLAINMGFHAIGFTVFGALLGGWRGRSGA